MTVQEALAKAHILAALVRFDRRREMGEALAVLEQHIASLEKQRVDLQNSIGYHVTETDRLVEERARAIERAERAERERDEAQREVRRLREGWDGWQKQALAAEQQVATLTEQLARSLRGVANAYGCFAGCTGALPGAPDDGSGHTPACRAARAALARVAGEQPDA